MNPNISQLLNQSLGVGGNFSSPTSAPSASLNFVPPTPTKAVSSATTGPTPAPTPTNNNTGYQVGGWYNGKQYQGNGQWSTTPTGSQPAAQSGPTPQQQYEQQVKDAINNGYGDYFSKLDDMLNNGLPAQRTDQEGVVNNSFNQSQNDLDTNNQNSGLALDKTQRQTETNQESSLKDLADNIVNEMQAGNVYLGSRGAGDSSAANQYAYALTQMGNKQRGDIMKNTSNIEDNINDRRSQVQNIYTNESNRLHTDKANNLLNIANWFADAQNQIRQSQANGKLNQGKDLAALSTDLLNNALNQLNNINLSHQNQLSSLQQWALYNSQNMPQLRQNMSAISNYAPQMPTASPLVGTPQIDAGGNVTAASPFGYGYGNNNQQQYPLM